MKLPKEVLAHYAESGFTSKDLALMGIGWMPPDDPRLSAAFPECTVGASVIPYHDPRGEPTGFFRLRFHGDYTPPGEKKPRRYAQLPGTSPELYWPPFVKSWPKVLADTSADLWITEGEKKAAALAKLGLPAIGLGGVWSFMSGGNPIDALALAQWEGRRVLIAFDSDAAMKPKVLAARRALRDEIVKRGGNPVSVELPTLPGHTKTGIDDFIAHHGGGSKALKKLHALKREELFIPKGFDASELRKMKFAPLRFTVEGLFPVGLTVFSGPPKVGKSWLLLDALRSLVRGQKALATFPTKKAEAAYLALEDSPRRLKKRFDELERGQGRVEGEATFHLFTEWPSAVDGGALALERWLEQNPAVSIVVVDTLAKLREAPKTNGHLYFDDYAAIAALKRIADTRGISLVVVHHLRKGNDDDPLNQISGSTGVTGAADALVVLKRARNENEGTLYVVGRDVQEQEIALEWKFPRWSVLGDAKLYKLSKSRRAILEALALHPEGLTATNLKEMGAAASRQAAQNLLHKLTEEGHVMGRDRGRYVLMGKGEKK